MNNVTVNFSDSCHGAGPLVAIVKNGIMPFIQIGIPIILIVLGTIDLGKAVISSDDKEVKAAQTRLIKRCIYAVAVFFIVTLVQLIFSLVASTAANNGNGLENADSWWNCWTSV